MLTSVDIPSSVVSIGEYAFSACFAMQRFVVDPSNTHYASDKTGALYDKDFTTLLFCPGTKTKFKIPSTVTSIGNGAFDSCKGLTSVSIPNSVTSIGISAFNGCSSLTSVTIPNSVTSIGSAAFWG
jgi:hypothetical protein